MIEDEYWWMDCSVVSLCLCDGYFKRAKGVMDATLGEGKYLKKDKNAVIVAWGGKGRIQ